VPKRAKIPEPEPKKFTPEEAKIAREVLRCKDYYQMLGVDRSVTDKDLKRAYKKKCLKVHPDKNNAPDADEAFKRINQAMTVLSDATKRRQYDQLRNTDTFERKENSGGGGGGGHAHRRGNFSQFTDDDFVSPEDFFNYMFFGQQPRGRNVRRQQQQNQQ